MTVKVHPYGDEATVIDNFQSGDATSDTFGAYGTTPITQPAAVTTVDTTTVTTVDTTTITVVDTTAVTTVDTTTITVVTAGDTLTAVRTWAAAINADSQLQAETINKLVADSRANALAINRLITDSQLNAETTNKLVADSRANAVAVNTTIARLQALGLIA